METKQFDFQKFLKDNYWYEKGYDLRELQSAPIPSTLGEGHCFEIYNDFNKTTKHYETKAYRNGEGKRIVIFEFTTLRGVSFNATHYYCSVKAYISNVCKEDGGSVGGYLGGHKVPEENCSMVFQLSNRVPWQDLDLKQECSLFGLTSSYEDYADEDGLVLYAGFEDDEQLHKLAHEVAEALFPSTEWEVRFDECY